MKELNELVKNLSTSRPIFRLTVDTRGNINANVESPIHKYRPTIDENNPLSELIALNYRENFFARDSEFFVDKDAIAKDAMNNIRSNIAVFLERNMGMRNPRQSKLYRWAYRSMPNNYEFNNVLVMVYKYLRTFASENMITVDDKNVANALALLSAIEEKYNGQR